MFNGPPFYEDWTLESAKEEFYSSIKKDNFSGLAYFDGDNIVGLTWGYSLPTENSGRVDYEKICDALESQDIDCNNTFYLSELAIDASYQGQGIGTKLIQQQKEELSGIDGVVFRTLNPAMLAVGSKVYGAPDVQVKEESSYEGGMAYGFKK